MRKIPDMIVAAALAVAAGFPVAAAERPRPSAETAAAVARAIERLPGPLAGTTIEVEAVSQADFERLQPSAEAALWLPDQRKARLFTARGPLPALEGRARLLSASEDISSFLDRIVSDFPDLTAGRWVLMSPVRLDAPAGTRVTKLQPTSVKIPGDPAPAAAANIFNEPFSSSLAANWNVTDNKGGNYQWGPTGCNTHAGTWAASPYAGGSLGPTTFCASNYPNSLQTFMMRSGCDNIQGAATASVSGFVEVNTEPGVDYVAFAVPVSYGSNGYFGQAISGNNPGVWQYVNYDLRAWPGGIGDMTSRPCVDLALVFYSDASTTYTFGARVDDIRIDVTSGGGVGGGGGGGGGSGTCTPSSTTLCLMSRFQVQAEYQTSGGASGVGTAVSMTSDTGYFWFFSASNVEVVAKMVNFCGISGNYGFYAGGMTDQYVKLKVTDTLRGTYEEYVNALGHGFSLIRDGPYICP